MATAKVLAEEAATRRLDILRLFMMHDAITDATGDASRATSNATKSPPLPPKTHECSNCHKPFASAGNLKKHMLTHTGERPFACAYCPSSFNQKIHAKIHERMHTGEKPYVCLMDGCLRAFADPKSVIWHRRMHTGERPYTCTVCSRTFRCKRGMFKHMRIHTGEKPYTCNVCGLAFSQNGNMKTHQKNIHGIGKVHEVVHEVVAAHAVIVDDLKVGVGLGGLCGSHVQ
ncbi:hypothetical protein BDR26DRAFT_854221 [Obelidium mucronatum]|nr:hypothetical protein BDR26DRAFT_854221 [Obelidium mucronatum]